MPGRYSYLSIFPDVDADIFAASLLMSYCSYSSLILSSIIMISLYILSKWLCMKHKGLSQQRVVSIAKNEYRFTVHFLEKLIKFLKSISDEWLNSIS